MTRPLCLNHDFQEVGAHGYVPNVRDVPIWMTMQGSPTVSCKKLRCVVSVDANRPYNGLSIGICIRTRRPCGVAPTELSFTLLFRGGLMLTASTTVYLLVFAFVQGDHAGSPLRVLAVITLGSPQQKNNDVYDVMCM